MVILLKNYLNGKSLDEFLGYDTLILKGKYQKTVIYDLEDESLKAYISK